MEVRMGTLLRGRTGKKKAHHRVRRGAAELTERVRRALRAGKNAIRENGVPGKVIVRESGGEPPHSKETQDAHDVACPYGEPA